MNWETQQDHCLSVEAPQYLAQHFFPRGSLRLGFLNQHHFAAVAAATAAARLDQLSPWTSRHASGAWRTTAGEE